MISSVLCDLTIATGCGLDSALPSIAAGSWLVLPQCPFRGHTTLSAVAQLWALPCGEPNYSILRFSPTFAPLLGELRRPTSISVLCDFAIVSSCGLTHATFSMAPGHG